MRYRDSSAIIPLIIAESQTERCEGLLRIDPQVATWWLSKIECASACNRLHREKKIDETDLKVALSDLATLWRSVVEIQPVEAVRTVALRLLRVHNLRAADSMQLASAILAAGEERDAFEFVSFDERLLSAADKESFRSSI